MHTAHVYHTGCSVIKTKLAAWETICIFPKCINFSLPVDAVYILYLGKRQIYRISVSWDRMYLQSHSVFQADKTGVFLASLVMGIACLLVFNAHHFFSHA